jgi:long-chain acyl-CoA synthetase
MINARLRHIAATAPATSGVAEGDAFFSYAALAERVERLAAGLAERGIGPGSVVALLVPNSPDIFVVAHALFALGAIAMPLGLTARRAELAALARTTGLAAVVAAPAQAEAAAALIADVAPAAPLFSTAALADIERAPARLPDLPGSTPALYLFSSGSTGLPKIVPHTHAELIADGERTSGAWRLQPDDRMVNILPPNFAMGFLMGVMDVLCGAGTTLYWRDPLPLALSRRKLLEAMGAQRVTIIGAVPAMYEALVTQPGAFALGLRLAFSGGAALRRETFEAFRDRFGVPLRQSYGATETIMVAHNGSTDPDASWASVGPPAGDARVRLAPLDTGLGPDVGELLVRSSSLMQGYLDNSAANAEAFDEAGWFRTGDLAAFDAEGRIVIRGRSKLLIEVSGYKIDPIEIEAVLAAHPGIAEAAVTGIPDSRAGHRLCAHVVRRADLTADAVIAYVRARLSSHKVPTEIVFREALPKSATGKLLRARL